jgi:nucleoid-associated protein YgaU
MRFGSFLAVAFAVGVAACGGDGHAVARDDRLVLEVGGSHRSLREALRAAGVEAAPPVRLREDGGTRQPGTAPGDGHGDGEGDAAGDRARGGATPAPRVPADDTPPRQPPPTEPDHIVVSLAPGQTLIHLARKHLGDGNRFREILTLNGWSEVDSRRLQPGQRVKVPRVAKNRSER